MPPLYRRRYTEDQKQQAIILAESIGPSAAARQLNVSVKSLANWLSAARAGQLVLRMPLEVCHHLRGSSDGGFC